MNETDTLMPEVSKVWNTVLYYEQLIKGLLYQRCWKKLKINCKGCNATYVKGVKRDSKYTIRAHNFLNINQFSIWKKLWKAETQGCPTIPSNDICCFMLQHIIAFGDMVGKLSVSAFQNFFILKISWILRKLWAKMCKTIFNFFWHLWHTQHLILFS